MNVNDIERGWAVYDSSNEKLGEIAEIGANYLLVQKGLIFVKDIYVPVSAVSQTDAANRSVYLSTTKSGVEAMGWDTPPIGDAAYGTTDRSSVDRSADSTDQRLRLHEEELNAQTRREQAGEVGIRKRVVEDQRELDVPVTHDEVDVRRVRVDRDAVAGDDAFTGDEETIRVPVSAESVEVTKRPRVVEEIEISKRPVTETRTVRDTVRREEAEVTQAGDVVVSEGSTRDLVGAGSDRFERTNVDDIENLTDEERRARGF